jgi:hypothetical protein
MGTILFECPMTGRPVSTGIETEAISFCRLSKTWLDLYCPLCGCFHGAKIWLQETSVLIGFSDTLLSDQTHIASHRDRTHIASHRDRRLARPSPQ